MANIYALFIGINRYERTEIGNLEGCVHDAESVAQWLQTQVRQDGNRLSVYKLYSGGTAQGNALPTRANIIATLQAYAGKLQKDDTFFLYYSGHGGKEVAHPFFRSPTNLLSTLVPCDSGMIQPNGRPVFDLLSIELRQLLYNIWQPHQPTILFIQDSCHSERSTRMFGTEQKQHEQLNGLRRREPLRQPQAHTPRKAEEYDVFSSEVQSAIARSSGNTRSFVPSTAQNSFAALSPQATHIHLAACTFEQYAYENVDAATGTSSGMFTRTLLHLLRETQGRISYAELANRLRYSIDGVFKQTPNLYYFSATPAQNIAWQQRQFLSEELLNEPQYALIRRPLPDKQHQWLAEVGALQGLRLMAANETWQTVARQSSTGATIAAQITYVAASFAVVQLAEEPQNADGWRIDIDKKHFQYKGVSIRFEQVDNPTQQLVAFLQQLNPQDFQTANSVEQAAYTLQLSADQKSLQVQGATNSWALRLDDSPLHADSKALKDIADSLTQRANLSQIARPLLLWAQMGATADFPALYPAFDWQAAQPKYRLLFDGSLYQLFVGAQLLGSETSADTVGSWLDKIERYERCLRLHNIHPTRVHQFEDYRFQLSAAQTKSIALQAGGEADAAKQLVALPAQARSVEWTMLNQYTGGLSADNAQTFYIAALWLGADLEIAQVAPATPFAPNNPNGAQPLGLPFALPARAANAAARRGFLKILISYRPFATHQFLQTGIEPPKDGSDGTKRSFAVQRGESASEWLSFTIPVDY